MKKFKCAVCAPMGGCPKNGQCAAFGKEDFTELPFDPPAPEPEQAPYREPTPEPAPDREKPSEETPRFFGRKLDKK
jgi:hypothetical protein